MEYIDMPANLAKEYKEFYLPELEDDPLFDEYYYYAALDGDDLVGLAVLDPTTAGARLVSIGVSPKYQRQGIGSELIARIDVMLKERYEVMSRNSEVNFTVSEILDPDKWEGLDGFLTYCGFTLSESRVIIKAHAKDITEIPGISNSLNKVKRECIVSLNNISDITLREFSGKCVDENLFPHINKSDYDGDTSLFYVEDGHVVACILNSVSEDNIYDNEWVYLSSHEHNKIVLPALILTSVQIGCRKGGSEFTILPVSDIGIKLADKLIPNHQKEKEIRVYFKRITPVGIFWVDKR